MGLQVHAYRSTLSTTSASNGLTSTVGVIVQLYMIQGLFN